MAGSEGGTGSTLADVRLVNCVVFSFILAQLFSRPSYWSFYRPLALFPRLETSGGVFCPTYMYVAEVVCDACCGFDTCNLEETKPAPNNLDSPENNFKA